MIAQLLLKYWKELLLATQAVVIYVGFKLWPKPQTCEPEVKVVEKVVVKDKIVYVDRVVTRDRVITKPDGTKIEETTRTEEQKREEKKEQEGSTEVVLKPVLPLPKYHLGMGTEPLALLKDKEYIFSLDAGIRLAGTPFFLKLSPSYNFSTQQLKGVSVGITVEF